MKYLALLFIGLFSISAQAQHTLLGAQTNAGAVPLQKVSLSGTIEVQETQSMTVTRARVSSLTPQRVFEEFGVSKIDYELVLEINGPGTLELVPKSAGSPLPVIEVLHLDSSQFVVDTKLDFGDVFSAAASTATGNLFEGLTGALRGRLTFKGPLANLTFKKFTISATAAGTNQAAAGDKTALLKFKIATTGNFFQKP